MAAPTILIPKYTTQEKKGKRFLREDSGRQTNPKRGYQSPAAYLDDLAAMKKAIILCSFCINKWGSPRKKGYRARFVPDPTGVASGYAVIGTCDACKQNTANMGGGKVYISTDLWSKVSMDPREAHRRARDAWKKKNDRQDFQKVMADVRQNPLKYPAKKRYFTATVNKES